MATKFTVRTQDFDNYAVENIGVSKDAQISESQPNFNFGASSKMWVRDYAVGQINTVMEITMPNDADVDGFDELIKIELGMRVSVVGTAGDMVVGIIEITDIWDEGDKTGSAGDCSWNEAQPSVPWANGVGAIKSTPGNLDDSETIIDSNVISDPASKVGQYAAFDLTPLFGMGDIKSFVLFILDNLTGGDQGFPFDSRESGDRPFIRITYRDYAVDAFQDGDSQLRIAPNPDNPEQPILTWGATDSPDFVNYKVYRETSPIGSVTALTPIATITNSTTVEYIDTASLLEDQFYYYLLVANDAVNTGDDGTKSLNAVFKRPDAASAEPTENVDVGEQVDMTVTSVLDFTRLYVEWGDSVDGYWVEMEQSAATFDVSHIYSETGAKVVKVRTQSVAGYWSDLTTICTKTVDDINPEATLIARPLQSVVGESVRCNGSRSQPAASDALIDQYDYYIENTGNIVGVLQGSKLFKVRGDQIYFYTNGDSVDVVNSTGNDGTYTVFGTPTYAAGPDETSIQVSEAIPSAVADGNMEKWVNNKGPVFDIIPVCDSLPCVQDILLRVFTDTGKTDTTGVGDATITINTGIPSELVFSKDTVINSRREGRGSSAQISPVYAGTQEIEMPFNVGNIVYTIAGMSSKDDFKTDIDKIRSRVENQTLTRIEITDEKEGVTLQLDGRIPSYNILQVAENYVTWSMPFRVFEKTEV